MSQIFLPSPDGRLCAVVHDNSVYAETNGLYMEYGVCIYETHTGRLLSSISEDHWDQHSWAWSACGEYFGLVAARVDYIVVLYEAATGLSLEPAWCPEAAAVLNDRRYKPAGWKLSPDCGMLLVTREHDHQQIVHVLDMHHGKLVTNAQMDEHRCPIHDSGTSNQSFGACILWHPSSRGLVLPGCSHDTSGAIDTMQKAGLVMGHCPLPAHLSAGSAFSPSEDLLLAQWQRRETGHRDLRRLQLAVLQCTQQGQQYSFEALHIMGEQAAWHSIRLNAWWCPQLGDSREVLLVHDTQGYSLISASGQPLGHLGLPDQDFQPLWSPGGTVCLLRSPEENAHRDLAAEAPSWALQCQTGLLTMPGSTCMMDKNLTLVWPASGCCILAWDQCVLKVASRMGEPKDKHSERCPFMVLHYDQM